MKIYPVYFLLVFVLMLIASFRAECFELTWEDQLEELGDLVGIASPPAECTYGQVSSRDRTGGNDDGLTGRFSFIREEAGRWILADISGPGAICRIWTTKAFHQDPSFLSVDPNAKLSIQLDDRPLPVIWTSLEDFFSGKRCPFIKPLSQFFLGGATSYIPIPFQKRCVVSIDANAIRYYQITYKQYPKNFKIETYSSKMNSGVIKKVNKIARFWEYPQYRTDLKDRTIFTETGKLDITGEKEMVIFEKVGSGTITDIKLKIHQDETLSLNHLRIQFFWDNSPRPAVDCPLGAFFDAGSGMNPMKSLLMEFDGENYICRFPMPYTAAARIVIQRKKSKTPILGKIEWQVNWVTKNENTPVRFFHAAYKPFESLVAGESYTVCDLTGVGHFVGCHLMMQGEAAIEPRFLEGDEQIEIDGKSVILGTGTEDFFNCGWYCRVNRLDHPDSAPTHGFTVFNPPNFASAYRWFIGDRLPFKAHFALRMEHGDVNDVPARYSSVAYYYTTHPSP